MAHPKVHSTRCISARRCVYATGALRCQHCIRFYYDDCDITQRISNLPAETAINVGQQIQSDTKEEPHELTQYSTTAEKVWEWLADGANILVIGCDVGTKNSSASWLCIDKNQQLSLNFRLQSRHVQHAGDWRIPTQAAIISQDGVAQLIFSPSDIDDHLGDDLEAGDIFTLLKLGLAHPNSQTDDEEKKMVTAAQDANNLTLERYRSANSLPSHVTSVLDIFREFLKYFWGIIRADIASRIPLPEEVLDHVLQEYTKVVVAVPAIWTSTMNNRFRGLLRDAGFPGAHIRSEPKLAAAVVVREQQQRLILDPEASAPRLEQAQRLLQVIRVVLNVGGGTAVSPELPQPETAGTLTPS